MDIATLGGLGIGFFVIIVGIVLTGGLGSLFGFVSISSVFITIGGSFAAIMVSNTLARTLGLMKVAMNAMRVRPLEEGRIISMIVTFSEKARREGLL